MQGHVKTGGQVGLAIAVWLLAAEEPEPAAEFVVLVADEVVTIPTGAGEAVATRTLPSATSSTLPE
ncbi:MAG: hypothetical protein A3K19_02485 [Lentisphaerae bacterium RIFOXYB12_FULL_65_16]|nr:MAG: hypothetical protein A3K18_27000 [Lentisphaerae bacterium RIFOXYA12_64_32]OGV85131.1 MAG: hypothetical protein A3K19_02485 [Lentisphaerae bacterium RIFOXYB12_FULL_65_16]